MLLPGLLPCNFPLYAVLADVNGEPELRRVACFGIVETDPETKKRVVTAFAVGQHVESVDFMENFVSLTEENDPDDWLNQCAAKRKELQRAATEQAKSKLYVPPGAMMKPGDGVGKFDR